MAGLLTAKSNAPAPAPAKQSAAFSIDPQTAATGDNLQDPILQQIEQGVEDSVPPEMKATYQGAMVAGMTIMFSKETSNLLTEQLARGGDIVQNVAEGIAGLIALVYNEGKLTEKDIPALCMAAIPLMCQALDYASATGAVEVTEELVAECTKATTMATMEKFGITRDQVGQVIAAGQQQGGAAPPPQGA